MHQTKQILFIFPNFWWLLSKFVLQRESSVRHNRKKIQGMFSNVTNIIMKGPFDLKYLLTVYKVMACENNFCRREIAPKNQG